MPDDDDDGVPSPSKLFAATESMASGDMMLLFIN